jgi:hypothetical protein
MGHSVRSCMVGMRIAVEMGLSVVEKGDLYYALLLKDAGCSSNSSKLFHILSADEIRAKRDVKMTDWTRVGWESLQYALTHVATGAPFLERIRTLVRVAANQQTESKTLVKIRCERVHPSPADLDFQSRWHRPSTAWMNTGTAAAIRGDFAGKRSRCFPAS